MRSRIAEDRSYGADPEPRGLPSRPFTGRDGHGQWTTDIASDLDKAYNQNLGDGQQQVLSADEANVARLGLLHQLIEEEILLQRAAKMKLNATP